MSLYCNAFLTFCRRLLLESTNQLWRLWHHLPPSNSGMTVCEQACMLEPPTEQNMQTHKGLHGWTQSIRLPLNNRTIDWQPFTVPLNPSHVWEHVVRHVNSGISTWPLKKRVEYRPLWNGSTGSVQGWAFSQSCLCCLWWMLDVVFVVVLLLLLCADRCVCVPLLSGQAGPKPAAPVAKARWARSLQRSPPSPSTPWWPPTPPSSLTSSPPSARSTPARPRAPHRAGQSHSPPPWKGNIKALTLPLYIACIKGGS